MMAKFMQAVERFRSLAWCLLTGHIPANKTTGIYFGAVYTKSICQRCGAELFE